MRKEYAMYIDNVKNSDELEAVLKLVNAIFPWIQNFGYKYSHDFWDERLNDLPESLLYAKDGDTICGSVFAWSDNGGITIGHCCVDSTYRGKGVGKALILEAEKRVKALGYQGITLGSLESAEGFYEKLGYTGSLLVQSEKHSIDELKSINTKYEVINTNVYDGTINQIYLRLPIADRTLQRKYEESLPGCNTQMIYGKSL